MTQKPESLPSGRWRAVARSALTGRRESRTFDRFIDAFEWAAARERAMDAVAAEEGAPVERRPYDRPLLSDYAEAWAKRADTDSAATRRNRESHARQLGKQWPHQRVHEITRPMVRAYLAQLRQAGRGPGIREARLTTLRAIMAAAVEDRIRDDDPTTGIKAPAAVDRTHRILTESELSAVVEQLPPWLRAAALLSHDAGLRIGEIAGLRAHRLDLLHASVEVADVVDADGQLREFPKGRQVFSVPLTPRVVAALRAHLEAYPPAGRTGHVFHDPDRGARLTTARIRDNWQRARAAAKLGDPAPRWHDLRHGCAVALARAGVPAYTIQAVLRHGSLNTSQRYIGRVSAADQRAALGRAFGGEQADTA